MRSERSVTTHKSFLGLNDRIHSKENYLGVSQSDLSSEAAATFHSILIAWTLTLALTVRNSSCPEGAPSSFRQFNVSKVLLRVEVTPAFSLGSSVFQHNGAQFWLLSHRNVTQIWRTSMCPLFFSFLNRLNIRYVFNVLLGTSLNVLIIEAAFPLVR